MYKSLAALVVVLVLVLLALGSGHPAVQADSTEEPTMAATQQVLTLSGGLSLQPTTTEEEIKQPKMTVTVTKPVLSGATGDIVDNFNKAVDDIVQKTAGDFKKETIDLEAQATLPPEIAELGSYIDVDYEVYDTHMSLISVKFFVGWYSAGAAHPNSYSVTLNYDTQGGKTLALADLFKPNSKYLQALSDYSVKALTDAGTLSFPEGAQPTEDNYKNWNITQDGLQITFDDYQVAPHAVGPQVVVVPYSALKSLIRADGPLGLFLSSGAAGGNG